jgi:hypothetical protein
MKRAIYFALLGVMTTVALAAKEPFNREETIEAQATVEAVYPESRLLVLNGASGSSVIAAGPEVKNFDQIKVGDKVKVAYKAAIAAKISNSKEDPKTTVDAAAYTAPKGSMPAAAVGQTIKTTVQIESVDTSFETSRLHAVSAFPLSGHMPPVDTWAAFNGFFDEMQGYGIVGS